jgi:PqqD family protein of HPr-rel-A system
MLYRADPPEMLRIVPLDSLTAIYHRASGQTHVVAEPVPELLVALGEGACDVATLAKRLSLEVTSETHMLLTERLDELIATGLVTRG